MENWVDLDLNLTKKTDGDINEFVGINAVKSSLRNIFETMQGSRRMIPEFAIGIYELLFDPIDEVTAGVIAENFLYSIEKWDSRIVIENLNIDAKPDKNLYIITLSFSLKNSNQVEEITQILRRN